MRLVALALNLLLFCICLLASAQEQKPITVRGKLVNIMGVGENPRVGPLSLTQIRRLRTRLSGENSAASSGIYWKRVNTTGCRPGRRSIRLGRP